MITINNGFLSATISKKGAELRSLTTPDGKEYIWQINPEVWGNSAPIMFPICGVLKDGEYFLDGKTYKMGKHGLTRGTLFAVEKVSDSSATFLLKSDENTKKSYPFDFEFRVNFSLVEKRLVVRYEVKNLSSDEMIFSLGSHEAFSTPEGIQDYDVVFPQKETLYSYDMIGPLLSDTKTFMGLGVDTIHLNYDLFDVDTLIFKDIESRSATLRKRDGTREIRIEFDGLFNFMLWSKKNATFVCMECWNGTPDYYKTDKDFRTKIGLQKVGSNSTYVRTHTIEVIK
jgi:galactose mutarotase-like enzyme